MLSRSKLSFGQSKDFLYDSIALNSKSYSFSNPQSAFGMANFFMDDPGLLYT